MAKVLETKAPETAAKEEFEAEEKEQEEMDAGEKAPILKPMKEEKESGATLVCANEILLTAIKAAEELLNEARIEINPEGLRLCAMDAANVGMIILNMPAAEFEKLEGEASVVVHLGVLKGMLKRAGAKESVTLIFSNPVKVQFGNRKFTVPQIASEDDKPQAVPQLRFETTFEAPVAAIAEALEDAALVSSDSLMFEIAPLGFYIKARGDLKTYSGLVLAGVKGKASCKYSPEYLGKMIKPKIAEKVIVNFGPEYPLRLDYKFGKNSTLQFVLAPRVDNN